MTPDNKSMFVHNVRSETEGGQTGGIEKSVESMQEGTSVKVGEGEASSCAPVTGAIVDLMQNELSAAIQSELFPRAREIEEGMAALQYEAETLTVKADAERKELEDELERLTSLVLSFQQHIAQLLPGMHPPRN